MNAVEDRWPGPVCKQPVCLIKSKNLRDEDLAGLIVRGLARADAATAISDEKRIEPRDVCMDCALRVVRGRKAYLTVAEEELLIEAARWSARRRRRQGRPL